MFSSISLELILLALVSVSNAESTHLDCRNLKYTIIGEKKFHIEKVCFGPTEQFFISAACLKDCNIWKKMKESSEKLHFSPIGTPSSNLCHDIGGMPYFILISEGNKSIERKVCYSKKDNSFVDEETLILKFKK